MTKKIIRSSTVPISLNILLKGQLSFLNDHFEVIALSSKGEDLDEVERREKVKVVDVEISRQISVVKDFISLVKLYKALKKEKPQIIHSITPKAGLLSMLAGKMAGVPIRMHTFTGLIFPARTGLMQKLLIKMDQLLCWAATDIYPEGKGVKEDLEKFGITKKKLKIIANGNIAGIDIAHYSPTHFDETHKNKLKNELKIKDSDFTFIFVGRLVGDKGINEMIEAYSSIRNKNTKLLLVGPFEDHLDPLKEKTLKKINDFDDIISVGFQKDVRPFFAISNALVFPSYREGFPNVVMQAGAMELPSIVSNINGCNEIIIEGQNGVIIPIKDHVKLAEAMKNMIYNKTEYEKMKHRSRKMIIDRYEQKVVWNALLAEYNLLLAQRKNYV